MTTAAGHSHPQDPRGVARARARLPSRDEAAELTGVLSLLADSTRARVLYALDAVDELCVGDIALALDVTEDAVGYALRLLRTAGFVAGRREGRIVYYRLAEGFPEPLREHCLRALVDLSRTAQAGSRQELADPSRTARAGLPQAAQRQADEGKKPTGK